MSSAIVEQSHALRHVRLPKSKREEALHEHWNLQQAAGHLALLGTMGGDGDRFEETAGHDVSPERLLVWLRLEHGDPVHRARRVGDGAARQTSAARLQAGARRGRRVLRLAGYRLSLVAFGRRTSGLRAEVAKALRAAPGMVPVSADGARWREAMRSAFENVSAAAVDRLEIEDSEADSLMSRMGTKLLGEHADDLAELPADVLRAVPLMSYADGLTDGRKVLAPLSVVAVSARSAPEQLYLP
jgi:hypothetical protein